MRTFGAISGARLRVIMLRAALAAPYATNDVCTMSLERDEMLTIEPSPGASTMRGMTRRHRLKAWVTLKRSAFSKNSSLVLSAGRGPVPPALFTRMSIRPNSAIVASTRRSS